jgi:hypothetical protein
VIAEPIFREVRNLQRQLASGSVLISQHLPTLLLGSDRNKCKIRML